MLLYSIKTVVSHLKGPVWAIILRASVVILGFTKARRLLFTSSILAADKSLRIFNGTEMAAKRSQRAMLNGQYRVFNSSDLRRRFSLYLSGIIKQSSLGISYGVQPLRSAAEAFEVSFKALAFGPKKYHRRYWTIDFTSRR